MTATKKISFKSNEAAPKAAQAMTGAEKYILLKTFLIPTGDDPEREDAAPPARGAKPVERGRQAAPVEESPDAPITKEQQKAIGTAIKAHKTAAQIAQMFGVHPTQVGGWKKQALAGLPDIFGNGREQMRQQADADKDELYKQIGQLKVELDFLKKRAGLID